MYLIYSYQYNKELLSKGMYRGHNEELLGHYRRECLLVRRCEQLHRDHFQTQCQFSVSESVYSFMSHCFSLKHSILKCSGQGVFWNTFVSSSSFPCYPWLAFVTPFPLYQTSSLKSDSVELPWPDISPSVLNCGTTIKLLLPRYCFGLLAAHKWFHWRFFIWYWQMKILSALSVEPLFISVPPRSKLCSGTIG